LGEFRENIGRILGEYWANSLTAHFERMLGEY